MRNQRTQPARTDRRGAVMIEMAIVMPVFSVMLLGIAEMSQALVVTHMVTTAARDGARLGIFDGTTNEEVIVGVQALLNNTLEVEAEDVTVTITVTAAPGSPDPAGQIANANRRDLVTVRVDVPYDRVAFFSPIFFEGTLITAVSSMRHE